MSAFRSFATLTVVCLAASLAAAAPASASSARGRRARTAPPAPVRAAAGALRFEPNVGQTDARVRFVARTRDGACFLTDRDAVLRARDGATVRIGIVGASDAARATASDPLPGTTSYLRGARDRWRSGVPGYATVRTADVSPGVDLVYYGANGRLEYDLTLAPGADASRLRLRVDGADRIEVDGAGDLVLSAHGGVIRQRAPHAYQPTADGARRPVATRYVVTSAREVGFALGAHDPRLPLVVDPEVAFSTYLGGSDFDDGSDVAVDASGAVFVAGSTSSTDFPGGARTGTDTDAFVTKLDANGGSVVYTAYVGGDDFDSGDAVAVDASGSAVVAGLTLSKNFPTVSAAQPELGGDADGFVAKLAPDGGSLVWSTYLGGTLDDQATDVLARADGTVVAGGRTSSESFPTAGAVASHFFGGGADGFVTVLPAAGVPLISSIYIGGSGAEQVDSLVDGGDGAAYATGVTDSRDFAICSEATAHPFVARVAPDETTAKAFACDASGLPACFAAGGPDGEGGVRIHALVSGGTSSLDVRAVTLDADLAVVSQVTFGGSGQDYPDAIAVAPDGTILVAGDTDSTDLPTVDPVQAAFAGDADAFVATLDPATGEASFATYLGGTGLELPSALATDASGNIYVAGLTFSPDFPVANAVQSAFAGASDAFVAKFGAAGPAAPGFSLSVDPASAEVARGKRYAVRVNVVRSGGFEGPVTIAVADTKAIKVKVTPTIATATGGFVNFIIKLKKKAVLGPHPIVFTGVDASGTAHTTTFTLTVK